METTWIPLLSLVSTVVSGILLWGFTSGRWTQRQELGRTHLAEQVAAIERALREEEAARRQVTEKTNVAIGELAARIAWLEREGTIRVGWNERHEEAMSRRLDQLEQIFRDIQRELHNAKRFDPHG